MYPYCGHASSKRHSAYERSFQDLPVMGMKSKTINVSLNVSSVNAANMLKDEDVSLMKLGLLHNIRI